MRPSRSSSAIGDGELSGGSADRNVHLAGVSVRRVGGHHRGWSMARLSADSRYNRGRAKEDKAGWSAFLVYLEQRGLRGVELDHFRRPHGPRRVQAELGFSGI